MSIVIIGENLDKLQEERKSVQRHLNKIDEEIVENAVLYVKELQKIAEENKQ